MKTVITDQRMFGLKTRTDGKRTAPARKPIRFMTNAEEVRKKLDIRCDGGHQHQALLDGRAKQAAIYPPALRRAICQGLIQQLQLDRQKIKSLFNLKADMKVGENHQKNRSHIDINWRRLGMMFLERSWTLKASAER